MNILEKLRKKMRKETSPPVRYPFTRSYTFGFGHGEDPTVEFVDEEAGIRKEIVDVRGRFVDFPGIEKGSWVEELQSESCLRPVIRYHTSFERETDERFLVIWEVQPDGRYWADDDGFGMEDMLEVNLYAVIDGKGNFEGPFRIYSVGTKRYYHREKKEEI